MQCLLSDDNGIKLKIHNRKTTEKFQKYFQTPPQVVANENVPKGQ